MSEPNEKPVAKTPSTEDRLRAAEADFAVEAPRSRLRRSMYFVLICVGVGAMLGRIAAVNQVDTIKLEQYRFKTRVNQEREKYIERGIRGEELAYRLDEFAWKLRDRIRMQRPFLSANDRSRMCTLRALVEPEMRVPGAPYSIDKVLREPGWDTIDMVRHDGHLYSSKPTLLPTLMAGQYWLIYRATGVTLGEDPFTIGRTILVTFNVLPLLVYFVLLARLIDRFGTTDWGRLFVMAAAVFGTYLTTFAVVINNHLPGAVCAMIALYASVRIWFDGERRLRYFFIAGMFAVLTATNELPAGAFCAALSLALLCKAPKQTILAYVPAALLVVAPFFGTNWIAHRSLKPAYMHRGPFPQATKPVSIRRAVATVRKEVPKLDETATHEAVAKSFGPMILEAYRLAVEQDRDMVMPTLFLRTTEQALADAYECPRDAETLDPIRAALAAAAVDAAREANPQADDDTIADAGKSILDASTEVDNPDNWYDYSYEPQPGRVVCSYWRDVVGIDRGEPSPWVYAFHLLIGHHGIFSLTPIWLLSLAGAVLWLKQNEIRSFRELAVFVVVITAVCLTFYLSRGPFFRNYGGVSSGLRWMFWFTPMWLLLMLPAADAMSARRWTRGIALIALIFSVLSVSYPTWNPWVHPWLMNYLHHLGWI